MSEGNHEFGFELRVCRWAEREWPPGGNGSSSRGVESSSPEGRSEPPEEREPVVVARQLGTRDRLWDTVVVESSPGALEARAVFGEDALDSDLLHVVGNAPRDWTWYRDALPHPGYPWRHVREAVHRAGDRGIVDTRKRGGRVQLRRKWRYPDWVDRLVAVENKPDLTASAARDLAAQVERDVERGLADEVWVATRATGAAVEPVLLERMPVETGILAVDPAEEAARVVWHPRTLAPDGRDPPTADKRLAIAERAYGRGWRSYVETMRPDCRHFRLEDLDFPHCTAKGRQPRAAECAGSCPHFEPEPPAWRQGGWPIEGGPGAGARRLLERRRSRRR